MTGHGHSSNAGGTHGHGHHATVGSRWLEVAWPLVRDHLPPAPARVLEIGCGTLGGFVPMLLAAGFDAAGVDREAPAEAHYVRAELERAELPERVDAVVASLSLHHVAEPGAAVDRIVALLPPGGVVVVLEWAWERFDEATARWCFERLGSADTPNWLHRRRDAWRDSGRAWPDYLAEWAAREGVHRADDVVRLLDARLRRRLLAYGPYFFPDLADTSESEEQATIDAGRITATRVQWVGEKAR